MLWPRTLSLENPHSEHHSLLAFSIRHGHVEQETIDRAILQDTASGAEPSMGVTAHRIMLTFSSSTNGMAHTRTHELHPLRYRLHSLSSPDDALEMASPNINSPAASEQIDFKKFREPASCTSPVSCTQDSLAATKCLVLEADIKNRASSTSRNCDTSHGRKQENV